MFRLPLAFGWLACCLAGICDLKTKLGLIAFLFISLAKLCKIRKLSGGTGTVFLLVRKGAGLIL